MTNGSAGRRPTIERPGRISRPFAAMAWLDSSGISHERLAMSSSPGAKFRAALAAEKPLQIAGAINAYAALLAQRAGFRALYLSGAGVANHSYGIPDTGDTTLPNVLIDAHRIAQRVPLPLLVDIDTGWDDPALTVREIAAAGAAAVHLEDQIPAKLCGHLPGKQLVSPAEMTARVRAAVSGKPDPAFEMDGGGSGGGDF